MGGTVNGQSVCVGYDGSGRRVSRTVGTARTDYWYDGTGMSLETGAASATYTRSPGGELLSRASGASVTNYSGNDQGSVTALTNTKGVCVRLLQWFME